MSSDNRGIRIWNFSRHNFCVVKPTDTFEKLQLKPADIIYIISEEYSTLLAGRHVDMEFARQLFQGHRNKGCSDAI